MTSEDEEELRVCQNPSCGTQETATRVCHHPQCTEENGELPLLLCRQCDTNIHRQPEFSGHLVLDAKSKRSPFRQQPYIIIETESEEDTEQDEDTVDGGKLFIKKPSKTNKRNVSPCEVERKLKRKKAVKKKSLSKNDLHIPHGLEAALAQIASPEGSDLMISFALSSEGEGREGTDGLRRNSMSDPTCLSRRESFESSRQDIEPRPIIRTPIRRQSHIPLQDNFFTVKICIEADKEDVEVVAAVQNMNLRDALEPILERRGIEIATVNAFIEKSNTPLPMTSDTSFLVGNTLELKEKDERDVEMVTQASTTKTRPSSAPKGSTKSSKSSGQSCSSPSNSSMTTAYFVSQRNSRRDSVGFVSTLLEPPPSKQRRGSLQLPFREHFFNSKGDNSQPKSGEVRAQDEPFGSLRGRRGHNLSIDDTHTVPSTSPQGTLTFSEGKKIGKTQKLSVASLFANSSGKDREKHEQLQEILNGYSSEGLPPLPELLSIGRPKFDETSFQMEAHWSMLVENASALSKRQHDQQEAIWELLQTELSYIDQIKVIIDIFQTCLVNVQQQSFLNEIETERLFSNIDEILLSNCKLWQDSLTKILEDARTHRHPLNPSLMKSAFTEEFQKLISPYTKYCMEQKQCVEYMKARHGDNELFRIFVVWAEAQKQCNRLKLTDLLVKPMQRLTKYSLLLQAILKTTEDNRQRRHVLEMIASVDKCVNSINSQMQQKHELERLEAIMTKIEPYDGVEAPNDECVKIIQEYNNNFNLMAPMSGFNNSQTRHLLMHSSLRMKESQGRTDVDCFLFTDLILVCKVNRRMDKYKIIRPPMRLDQIVVSELRDKGSFLLIYTNEYHVPIAAYSFHGDPSAVRAWLESIRDAQSDYQRQRLEGQSRRASEAMAMKKEVEYAPLPGSSPLTMELHPSAVYPHTSSVESTEGQFVPNISTALKHQSAIELSSPDKSLAGKYRMLPLEHASSCAEFTPLSVDTICSQNNAPSLASFSPSRDYRHKPVKASHSVPSMMGNQLKSVTLDYDEDFNGSNFSSDVLSADLALEPHSISHTNLAEPGPVEDDFNSKLNKINSRRVSRNEKRYYTADSIQELQQKDKDSSIYKRLSWQDEGHLDEKLRQKILSMESIPTSSGVSSSSPLHLNPERDIREESELQKSGDSRTLYCLNDRQSSVTNNFSEVRCGQEDSTNPSDMIVLFHSLTTSEPENGISSVNLPALDDRHKKLSPAQILKMKKQLLLTTADVEASEV